MQQEFMIPHECHHCGVVDEAKFTFAGPHIKQICNGCGKYVKFFNKSQIPDVREIKLKIWSITQDIDRISAAKQVSGFVDNLTGLDNKIVYWRLYLAVRKEAALCN